MVGRVVVASGDVDCPEQSVIQVLYNGNEIIRENVQGCDVTLSTSAMVLGRSYTINWWQDANKKKYSDF